MLEKKFWNDLDTQKWRMRGNRYFYYLRSLVFHLFLTLDIVHLLHFLKTSYSNNQLACHFKPSQTFLWKLQFLCFVFFFKKTGVFGFWEWIKLNWINEFLPTDYNGTSSPIPRWITLLHAVIQMQKDKLCDFSEFILVVFECLFHFCFYFKD